MTISDETWLAELQDVDQRKRERLATARDVLVSALRRRGITAATIDYDGEGDNGQIIGVTVTGGPAKSRCGLSLNISGTPHRYASLEEALEGFGWLVLDVYHAGFEDNEGGYGNIHIDVERRAVTLDHNDRITDVVNSVQEV